MEYEDYKALGGYDVEFILSHHNDMTKKEIADALDCSLIKVYSVLDTCGLVEHKKMSRYRMWSKYECDYVWNNYHVIPTSQIAEKLNRTERCVMGKYNQLKKYYNEMGKLTDGDIAFIYDNYKELTSHELARKLDVSQKTINYYLNKAGVKAKRPFRRVEMTWGASAIEEIVKESETMPISEIARKRGVTRSAIYGVVYRAKKYRVKKREAKMLLEPNQMDFLLKNMNQMSMIRIAEELNVPYWKIVRQCNILKYKNNDK